VRCPTSDSEDASTRKGRFALDDRSGGAAEIRRESESGRSSRQAGATLGAPRLEHGTSGPGAHPSAKTVLLRAAAGIGLIGTLHVILRDFSDRVEIGRCSRWKRSSHRPSREARFRSSWIRLRSRVTGSQPLRFRTHSLPCFVRENVDDSRAPKLRSTLIKSRRCYLCTG
jgi:hypothetical protein